MYTPSRSKYNSPVGGDRFIPTRSLMDMDYARSTFSNWTPVKKPKEEEHFLPTTKDEYRRRIEEHFNVDSEGKPRRMLVFRTSNGCKRKLEFPEESLTSQSCLVKPVRHVTTYSDLVLDAPNLRDSDCLKLMDWSRENILAIALGLSVYLYKADTCKTELLLETDSYDDYPSSLAWSNDGRTLAVGFSTSRIEVWDAVSRQLIGIVEEHGGRVGSLCWNRHVLSSGSRDGLIINHDVRANGRMVSRLRAHLGEVCGLRWSEDGAKLASGGNDGLVHVWDRQCMRQSSKYLYQFKDHTAPVRALAWCPFKSNTLATGGGPTDGSIKIWSTESGNCVTTIDTGSQVCALEWNKHQKEILSAHGLEENLITLRSYPSLRKIVDLKGHKDRVLHLTQSPDGSRVASASPDETIRFWKVFGPPPSPRKGDDESMFSLKRMHIR
ncbi:cell division cycle 20.2, cofactor of APC complex-like isoform X1 [Carex rostrata]